MKIVTYNVSYGAFTDHPGWEPEVVGPCRSESLAEQHNGIDTVYKAYDLTYCSAKGARLLSSEGTRSDIFCLQEIPSKDVLAKWVRYMQDLTSCRYGYAAHRTNDSHLFVAVVWDLDVAGKGIQINHKQSEVRRMCTVHFPKIGLVVTSVHIPHRVAKAVGGIRSYVETAGWPGLPTEAVVAVLGDFNDTYGQGSTELRLGGGNHHHLTLRNPGDRTCCADKADDPAAYPFAGDYVYLSTPIPAKTAILPELAGARTSDHRAVQATIHLGAMPTSTTTNECRLPDVGNNNSAVWLVVDYPTSGSKSITPVDGGGKDTPAVLCQSSSRKQAWSYDRDSRHLRTADGRYLDTYEDVPRMVHLWTSYVDNDHQKFYVNQEGHIVTPGAASEPLRCQRFTLGGQHRWRLGFHLGKKHPVVRMEGPVPPSAVTEKKSPAPQLAPDPTELSTNNGCHLPDVGNNNSAVRLVVDYPTSGPKSLTPIAGGGQDIPAVLCQSSSREQAWSYDRDSRHLRTADGRYLDTYEDVPRMAHLWTSYVDNDHQEFYVTEEGHIFTPGAASEPLRCQRFTQGGQHRWRLGFHLDKKHPVVRMEEWGPVVPPLVTEKKNPAPQLAYPPEFSARGTQFRRIVPTNTDWHTWHCPVYIGTGGDFVTGGVPVLLIERSDDFVFLVDNPETTHHGAFGSDTRSVDDVQASELPAALRTHKWSVVWKWPADMFNMSVTGLSGDEIVTGIPLPVGTYPLLIDDWTPTPVNTNAELPLEALVTKWRIRAPSGAQVHYLSYHKTRVAMVTSRYFFADLWSASETEMLRAHSFLDRLREETGIQGIGCHGQHHAIVFYQSADGTLLRPELFARMVKDDHRGLQSLLVGHGLGDWSETYAAMFGTGGFLDSACVVPQVTDF
jgi:endonuclease/exonuclease/phosphatase family metal-dependent hydrolase